MFAVCILTWYGVMLTIAMLLIGKLCYNLARLVRSRLTVENG